MELLWGIDLGGTKIEGVLLEDRAQTKPLLRMRVPTEQQRGYDHILQQIAKMIDLMAAESGVRPQRIGIGTPGSISPSTGRLRNSNTLVLNGRNLLLDLEQKLGLQIIMANDANCFALAEARMGSAVDQHPDARVVFGIIMGTGVGGGVVYDGQVWNGRQGIGGEWGHTFLDESGGACYCGKIGCVERVISGPALEAFYANRSGRHRPLSEILTRYRERGDADSTATVERLLHFFGKGVANVINLLDPDIIVLGGGLSKIDLLYSEGIARVRQFVFNPQPDVLIVPPKLGDSAGVFGAALL